MRTEEIGKQGVRRQLVSFTFCTEAIEVSVVGVLQHLGRNDAWHKKGISSSAAGCLDPDGNVDGDVEKKAEQPMGKKHGTLTGRSIDKGLKHATETLKQ